jgi:hypothetical protein
MSGGISTVPVLVGGEDSQARTNLGVCALRGDALALLRKAGTYLTSDRNLSQGLRSILNAGEPSTVRDYHLPVLFAEMESLGDGNESVIVADTGRYGALGSRAVRESLNECFHHPSLQWVNMDRDTQLRIETFLRNHASGANVEKGSHQARVGEMVLRLWQASRPAVLKPVSPELR